MRKQKKIHSTPLAIQEKIQQAYDLHEEWGNRLREDLFVSALIHRLQGCLENTRRSMIALRVVSECKRCEEEEGGSCCGSGIEEKYDTFLLLTNLLLGGSLPNGQMQKNSCYFLGEKGCTLAARHVLCVNYICEKLKKKLSREELIALQTCAGEELETLFILTEAVKKRVRASPNAE